MGYFGRLELKRKAQAMRRHGRSYREIKHRLNIPKTTISDWCKNIQLTPKQIQVLYQNKKTGALKGSYIAAQNKKRKKLLHVKTLYDSGFNEVSKLDKRDRFIAGISFYSAEGTKSDKGCAFSNSNPSIINFMVCWFQEFGHVPIEKFRGAIWLHEELDELTAKKYWSNLTKISMDHFYKTYRAVNKTSSKKIRKNLHLYGVFTFYVSDVILARTMLGWIGGILRGK